MIIYAIQVNGNTVAVETTGVDALDSALGVYLETVVTLTDSLYSFKNIVKQLASGKKVEGVQVITMEV